MLDSQCKIIYLCDFDSKDDCVYRKPDGSIKCKYKIFNVDSKQIFCTSSVANVNKLCLEFKKQTGLDLNKIKE